MLKISIIGAGSAFTQDIVVDILSIDGLSEGTIALVDIDQGRLEIAHQLVEMIIKKTGKKWNVIASVNRREVIEGFEIHYQSD